MRDQRSSARVRFILCSIAALTFGLVGLAAGGEVARIVAQSENRDIGDLKGMYVVGSLVAAPVLALASVWACLAITRATRRAVWLAGAAFGLALLGAIPFVAGAYEPVKTSGSPVLAYELRLPASLGPRDPSDIDVTMWSERDGFGCSIKSVRAIGGRQVVSGTCVIDETNQSPTMSLRIRPEAEGYWRVPRGPDARRETSFGEWITLEFMPSPRATAPLPGGPYEIRYWVRSFV